jgi:hypothetical protein
MTLLALICIQYFALDRISLGDRQAFTIWLNIDIPGGNLLRRRVLPDAITRWFGGQCKLARQYCHQGERDAAIG